MTGADQLDPRIVRTREVVLAAAAAALVDVGFERISIDDIAERSGVARSTIYRNWPDRNQMLAEAFRCLLGEPSGPSASSGCLRTDLETMAGQLVAKLSSEDWARTVPSLVGAAVHCDAIRIVAASFSGDRRAEMRRVFEQAHERGQIEHPDQIDSAMDRFIGPFFFRRLVAHLPLDEAFIDSQVEATLRQVGVRPSTAPPRPVA